MEDLYRGIGDCLEKFGGVLAGGETSSVPPGSAAVISIAATGSVRREHLVLRSTAKPGDALLVTGTLGGSIQGKHLDFTPRVVEVELAGIPLQAHRHDGSFRRPGEGSSPPGRRFRLWIPIWIARRCRSRPVARRAEALGDGEDYEILFAIEPARVPALLAAWSRRFPELRAHPHRRNGGNPGGRILDRRMGTLLRPVIRRGRDISLEIPTGRHTRRTPLRDENIMKIRFYSPFWLGLLLVCCEKPREAAAPPEKQAPPPRVTKLDRPAREELPDSPEQLRENLESAGEIESPEARNKALEEVIWNALELDPELAQEGFHQLAPGSEEKKRLIQHFAMRRAAAALDEAIQWATTLETEQEKSLAFDSIALVLADSDPLRAAQMLSESGIAGRDFDVAVVQVVQRWAAISAVDAAAWVVLFESGEARRASLKEVVSVWSHANPEGALAWMETLKDPTIHQEAVTGMAQTILEMPEEARSDLLQFATPEIRAALEKIEAAAPAKE